MFDKVRFFIDAVLFSIGILLLIEDIVFHYRNYRKATKKGEKTLKYYVHLIAGDEVFKAITEASNIDEAERTFIACLDSGDYDHFIDGRDFTCGEIEELTEHVVNSSQTHELNRILPMEAQIIYYSKGRFARKDDIRDVKTFLQFGGECESYKVSNQLLEKIAKRIYRKLYLEGFLPPINTTSDVRIERFWEYYHALANLDDSLIDIPVNDKLIDIIKRKAI